MFFGEDASSTARRCVERFTFQCPGGKRRLILVFQRWGA